MAVYSPTGVSQEGTAGNVDPDVIRFPKLYRAFQISNTASSGNLWVKFGDNHLAPPGPGGGSMWIPAGKTAYRQLRATNEVWIKGTAASVSYYVEGRTDIGGIAAEIAREGALGGGASHTHVESDITNLSADLATKASRLPPIRKSADYTAVEGDVVILDATNGSFTITLATAATYICLKRDPVDISSNQITVVAQSGGTIDGETNLIINAQRSAREFVRIDATNWVVI